MKRIVIDGIPDDIANTLASEVFSLLQSLKVGVNAVAEDLVGDSDVHAAGLDRARYKNVDLAVRPQVDFAGNTAAVSLLIAALCMFDLDEAGGPCYACKAFPNWVPSETGSSWYRAKHTPSCFLNHALVEAGVSSEDRAEIRKGFRAILREEKEKSR